ncbi:MAG TPA: hypothetical protein V6D18_10180 [Thermosynechococcaceae cyanobacterium]
MVLIVAIASGGGRSLAVLTFTSSPLPNFSSEYVIAGGASLS